MNWRWIILGAVILGAISVVHGIVLGRIHPPPNKARYLDEEVQFTGISMVLGGFVAYLFQCDKRRSALALIIMYAVASITLTAVVLQMASDR